MSRLPDRFDLWVRRARACPDPARQVDWVLGALAALPAWHFLNAGPVKKPQPATTDAIEGGTLVLVFTDAGRVEEMLTASGRAPAPSWLITLPTREAMVRCLDEKHGLLVNPGEEAAVVPFPTLETFHREWSARHAAGPVGFWIPNMGSEEEDFWREHGL